MVKNNWRKYTAKITSITHKIFKQDSRSDTNRRHNKYKKKCTLAHQGSTYDNKAPREENITLKGARLGLTANYIGKWWTPEENGSVRK